MTLTLFNIWVSALLTLAIFSFLWKDNPVYKVAEHLFVGASAGYSFVLSWHTNVMDDFMKKVAPSWFGLHEAPQYRLLGGGVLAVMILLRLVPRIGWISRWGIAFIVGFNAGVQIFSQLSGFLLAQLNATLKPFFVVGQTVWQLVRQGLVAMGMVTGLSYFYFSREHKGWFGVVTRVGIYFLMIGFGAAYGNTVMTRISILAGRVVFLLSDWLHLIHV